MCGIAGIVGLRGIGAPERLAERMAAALAHRGPDAEGIWRDSDHLVFGHRRLSIIDLSPESNQPFHSTDGRYVIVYNGELYNYRELKAELKDVPFRTVSDTEVVLAAYARCGAACLDRFKGMFAFALWDREMKEVFIARDRLGIKPLYFWQGGGRLLFASELRALLATDLVPGKLDHEALGDYLRYQTVHSPATLVKDVRMLMPGALDACEGRSDRNTMLVGPGVESGSHSRIRYRPEHRPHCGGPLKIIAAIVDSTVIARILTHLGLLARAPPRAAARAFDRFELA